MATSNLGRQLLRLVCFVQLLLAVWADPVFEEHWQFTHRLILQFGRLTAMENKAKPSHTQEVQSAMFFRRIIHIRHFNAVTV